MGDKFLALEFLILYVSLIVIAILGILADQLKVNLSELLISVGVVIILHTILARWVYKKFGAR